MYFICVNYRKKSMELKKVTKLLIMLKIFSEVCFFSQFAH